MFVSFRVLKSSSSDSDAEQRTLLQSLGLGPLPLFFSVPRPRVTNLRAKRGTAIRSKGLGPFPFMRPLQDPGELPSPLHLGREPHPPLRFGWRSLWAPRDFLPGSSKGADPRPLDTEVAIEDHLASPVPLLLFDFQSKERRDPKNSPPRVDLGLPHLTGIAHNIGKGRGTTQIFSHISDGADFVMLGEVNKELDLPLSYSTGPRAGSIFHNLGEGGPNGVALVVGPRLAPFSSPLPPP